MIDVETEDLVPMQFAPDALPKGVKASLATMKRWVKPPGVRGRVLETVMVGGIRYTSREAIIRFCTDPGPTTAVVTPSQRRRQTSSALKALAGMGIG